MAFKHKEGYGTIFPNDKGDNPNRPDYKGSMTTPDGQAWSLSLWKAETREGKPSLQVKIEKPYVAPASDESPI